MQKLNRAQKELLSFGYPSSIVREYKTGSKYYKEEVKRYVEEKVDSYKRDASRKVI